MSNAVSASSGILLLLVLYSVEVVSGTGWFQVLSDTSFPNMPLFVRAVKPSVWVCLAGMEEFASTFTKAVDL